ncbi:MAG: T9SS type A sorting domain-containing protein [Flavobacteriales bacterium]|nr:T9SS type A sorting domain-containing protein [Flavobacteriales bacterium]
MLQSRSLILLVLFTHGVLRAQTITLQNGTLTIAEGTTVLLEGPISFNLQPGSEVENNGTIDLGTEATMNEPLNSPVRGTGHETTTFASNGPFNAVEPGGLGLTLTSTSTGAPDFLERWHTPIGLPSGDESIARWYRTVGGNSGPGTFNAQFGYDPSELHGLNAAELALLSAATQNGPWTDLNATVDAGSFELSAPYPAPWGILTAFDADAPTGLSGEKHEDQFRVWPTLTSNTLSIEPVNGVQVVSIEVFDLAGQRMAVDTERANGLGLVDVHTLAAGQYLLRLNGTFVIRFTRA